MNHRDHKVCVIAGATQGLGAPIAREASGKHWPGKPSGAKK